MARPGLARPQLSGGGIARPGLARPGLAKPSPSLGGAAEVAQPDNNKEDASEKAMKALNTAASLLRKDRADARRLGMESLILLTDPLRAGTETAKIASGVVLLGSAREGTAGTDDGIDALFDEGSGLGIRETILETITTNGEEKTCDEDSHGGFEGIEREFADVLFGLCLAVLSNALHAIGADPSVSAKFIDETDSVLGRDAVLSSLLRILGRAGTEPHDACLAARCLGVLFEGCGNVRRARARRDLDAERIVATALEAGNHGHAKLADASRAATAALAMDNKGGIKEDEEREGQSPIGVQGNSRGPKWRSGGRSRPFPSLSKRMRKGSSGSVGPKH